MEFIELNGGLTVPETDITGLLALEARGMRFIVDGEKLRIRGPVDGQTPDLTADEVAFIKARKAHLMALVAYEAPNL